MVMQKKNLYLQTSTRPAANLIILCLCETQYVYVVGAYTGGKQI